MSEHIDLDLEAIRAQLLAYEEGDETSVAWLKHCAEDWRTEAEMLEAQRDQLAQRVEAGVSGISAAMQQIGVPGDGYPSNIALAHQMLAATLSFLDSAPSTGDTESRES
jgi:hypothetical protein